MHELSLLSGVVDTVVDAAEGRPVTQINLEIGTLSGVVPEIIDFSWPIAASGTPLEGTRLSVTIVQAAVWCPGCEKEQPIDEYFALLCPECGTPTADLRTGKQFRLTSIDVET